MVKIVLADDQTLVRQAFRGLLEDEPGIDVIGEAGDGLEAVKIVQELKPDILITDLKMPGLDGIEVTRRIKELLPEINVVVLSMFGDKAYVNAALKAGACGYVLKKYGVEGLVEAIHCVYKGERYLGPSIVE